MDDGDASSQPCSTRAGGNRSSDIVLGHSLSSFGSPPGFFNLPSFSTPPIQDDWSLFADMSPPLDHTSGYDQSDGLFEEDSPIGNPWGESSSSDFVPEKTYETNLFPATHFVREHFSITGEDQFVPRSDFEKKLEEIINSKYH